MWEFLDGHWIRCEIQPNIIANRYQNPFKEPIAYNIVAFSRKKYPLDKFVPLNRSEGNWEDEDEQEGEYDDDDYDEGEEEEQEEEHTDNKNGNQEKGQTRNDVKQQGSGKASPSSEHSWAKVVEGALSHSATPTRNPPANNTTGASTTNNRTATPSDRKTSEKDTSTNTEKDGNGKDKEKEKK
jgi:hypothetical protein